MLRTSASTDMAAATAEYTCVMSATTARGSPCSRRRSDHRIRAGDDPDPIINAAGASSTVTWQAASRSGFMCLVPDTSSNTSCPATGGRSRTAVTVSSRNQAACVASSGTTRKPPPKGTTADADRTGAPSLKRSRSTLRTSMSTTPTFHGHSRQSRSVTRTDRAHQLRHERASTCKGLGCASRWFKRRWEETRGDEFASWGAATYFFEVSDDGWPSRQIEVYDHGPTLRYCPGREER